MGANRQKWTFLKNSFGFCFYTYSDTRKSLPTLNLKIGPKKILFTPTPNIATLFVLIFAPFYSHSFHKKSNIFGTDCSVIFCQLFAKTSFLFRKLVRIRCSFGQCFIKLSFCSGTEQIHIGPSKRILLDAELI